MNISLISNINTSYSNKVLNKVPLFTSNSIHFRGRDLSSDVFQKEKEPSTITITNPYTNKPCTLNYKNIDLTKKQQLVFRSKFGIGNISMFYNPDRTEILHDKNTNENIEVVVLESSHGGDPCFHFFSKDLKTNYGYGMLNNDVGSKDRNVKEIFANPNNKNLSGIEELVDKYSVLYCKKIKVKNPSIVSYSKPENYKESYASGRRFVLPEKDSDEYKFFMDKYNNSNPNKIIKNEENTSNWPSLKMYLPKEKVDEYYNKYNEGFNLINPIGGYEIETEKYIDITKPQTFSLKNSFWKNSACTVDFDPKRKGQLVDKKTGELIDVFILKIHDKSDEKMDSFHFVSKDFEHEYGHVELDRDWRAYHYALTKDYPKENIKGDRIIVHWLINEDDENIGGVGKLADKVAVKYCLENNIKPNIISEAGDDSYLAHHSRGKQFFKPSKNKVTYNFLMEKYGTPDPNEALEILLEKSKKTGKKVDLSEWNEHYFYMYLPQDLVEKYKNEGY